MVTAPGSGRSQGSSRGRIVHVLEAFTGGTARHLDLLLRLIQGWDQSAIVSVGREARAIEGVERLRAAGSIIRVVPMRRGPSPVADMIALFRIFSILREIRPDIVHCHSAKAGFLGRAAARLAGVPASIYTPHALPFHERMSAPEALIYRTLERVTGRWTSRIVAVSATEFEQVERARLVSRDRITLIPNGVPLTDSIPESPATRLAARAALGIPAEKRVVVCVAHLRPQKAPLDWVRMAGQVFRQIPESFFVWAGDGEMEHEFLAALRQALPDGTYSYQGYLEHTRPVLEAADCLAMASLWEGCSYVLLDAMAMGLPCAVTAVAGCRDAIVDGQNGTISPPGDPASLASSVIRVLSNPSAAREMGQAARRTIQEQYNIEQFVEKHQRMYEEVVGGRKKRE